MQEDTTEGLKDAIRVDAGQLRGHIDEAVRSSVEETLNGLLEAEADRICGAERYQRSADRVDTRAGHYERQLETKAGAVKLKMPKLRSLRSRQRSSNGIAGGRPRWKSHWWRCTWRECPCAESKTSPKRCGAPV